MSFGWIRHDCLLGELHVVRVEGRHGAGDGVPVPHGADGVPLRDQVSRNAIPC
ncbi:MAG: hypothetical protein ACK55Z_08095 [bacterium]